MLDYGQYLGGGDQWSEEEACLCLCFNEYGCGSLLLHCNIWQLVVDPGFQTDIMHDMKLQLFAIRLAEASDD